MCGIVGYVGHRDAAGILVRGLRKLEYRGYDSSGVCTITPSGSLSIAKSAGRIEQLAARLKKAPSPGQIGIGHTRWATHGPATDENAHPHVGGNDLLAVVHNGVIENFRTLKERLESEGYRFRSGTDTEVIAHLIASCLEQRALAGSHTRPTRKRGSMDDPAAPSLALRASVPADESASAENGEHAHLVAAVNEALSQLQGTYGLAIVFRERSRRDHRRPARQPAGRGRRQWRAFSGERPRTPGRLHGQDRLSVRPRAGRVDRRLAARHASRSGERRAERPRTPVAGPLDRLGRLCRTTCSRRSSSSPRSLENAMRGRLDDGRRHRHVRRAEPHAAAPAPRRTASS